MGKILRRLHFGGILFFDCFGLLMPLPLAADLAKEFFGTNAAFVLSLSAGMRAFFTLLCGPLLGFLSDRFGRRPFLIAAHIPLFLSYLFAFCVARSHCGIKSLLYTWLVFDALTGTVPMLLMFLTIIADDVSPGSRASAFGLAMAANDVALILAPAVAGCLSLSAGYATAMAAVIVGLLLSLFFPETRPNSVSFDQRMYLLYASRRSSFSWRMRCPDKLSIGFICSTMVIGGIQATFFLFVEAQLQVTRRDAGVVMSILACSGLLVQACGLRPMVRYLGLKKTLVVGLCLQMMQNLFFVMAGLVSAGKSGQIPLSPSALMIACGAMCAGFGTLTFPCTLAMKANAVSAEEQGYVQGSVAALQAFSMGIGQMLFGGIFSLFCRPQPSLGLNSPIYPACYACSFLVLVIAVVAALMYKIPEGPIGTTSSQLNHVGDSQEDNPKQPDLI